MAKSSCIIDACTRPARSRGMCHAHYEKARRSGRLPQLELGWHKLSRVDLAREAAVCSICGPTRIRVRTDRSNQCYAQRSIAYERRRTTSGAPEYRRQDQLQRLYGITADDYQRMHAEQRGGCAICSAPTSSGGRRLAVDHCHSTGKVRGLLCTKCNQAIGLLKDDPALLRKALEYLSNAAESAA